jgi:hypothetical protein
MEKAPAKQCRRKAAMNFDMARPQKADAEQHAMLLRREQDAYMAGFHPGRAKAFERIGCGLYKNGSIGYIAGPSTQEKSRGTRG